MTNIDTILFAPVRNAHKEKLSKSLVPVCVKPQPTIEFLNQTRIPTTPRKEFSPFGPRLIPRNHHRILSLKTSCKHKQSKHPFILTFASCFNLTTALQSFFFDVFTRIDGKHRSNCKPTNSPRWPFQRPPKRNHAGQNPTGILQKKRGSRSRAPNNLGEAVSMILKNDSKRRKLATWKGSPVTVHQRPTAPGPTC